MTDEVVRASAAPELSEEAKQLQAEINTVCETITKHDGTIRRVSGQVPGFISVANMAVTMATIEIIKEGIIASGSLKREDFLVRQKAILESIEKMMAEDVRAAQVLAARRHQSNGPGRPPR